MAKTSQPTASKRRRRSTASSAPKLQELSKESFSPDLLVQNISAKKSLQTRPKTNIFSQGNVANSVFFIQKGRVKLSVVSRRGKEATIAILGPGEFFGEGSVAGQPLRMYSATSLTDSSLLRIRKNSMMQAIHRDSSFSERFMPHLLARNIRYEEDLVDHLFNSSEKRLARILLLLAQFGREKAPDSLIPNIRQGTLAEMVGTTRSRISFFMNKFRRLGFLEYNGGLRVHNSLLNVVLHD